MTLRKPFWNAGNLNPDRNAEQGARLRLWQGRIYDGKRHGTPHRWIHRPVSVACQRLSELLTKAGRSSPATCRASAPQGSGVIWNGIPFETMVIPAQAGIQSAGGAFPMAGGVDSRFRGNDCTGERPCLANDTTTRLRSRVPSKSMGVEKDPSPALLRRAPSPLGEGCYFDSYPSPLGRGCPAGRDG